MQPVRTLGSILSMAQRGATDAECLIAIYFYQLADIGDCENIQIDINGIIISVHGGRDLEQYLDPPHNEFMYVTPCILRVIDGGIAWVISIGSSYCYTYFLDEETFKKDMAILRLAT